MSKLRKKNKNVETVFIDKVDSKKMHDIYVAKIDTKTNNIISSEYIDSYAGNITPTTLYIMYKGTADRLNIKKVYTAVEGMEGIRISEFDTIRIRA